MSEKQYESICHESAEWVRQGGAVALDRFGKAVASVKPDRSPVTDADHAVQELLLTAIARRFPGDAVISEEIQAAPQRHAELSSADRCWVVDPIDGTRSYARGFPGFGVSLALMEAGGPVVGHIYSPLTGQLYSAWQGGGAWLGEQRLHCRDERLAGDVLIAIPSSSRRGLPAVVHGWIDRMVLRNIGSTALHLALVAAGSLDAVYADEAHLWDLAAGEIILREAGAQLVSPTGQPYFPVDLNPFVDRHMPLLAAGPATLEMLVKEYQGLQG